MYIYILFFILFYVYKIVYYNVFLLVIILNLHQQHVKNKKNSKKLTNIDLYFT